MYYRYPLLIRNREKYSFPCLLNPGLKERKKRRQSRRRDNVYKVEGQQKKRKIITNNFLARDLKLASVNTEKNVNTHTMLIWTLENVNQEIVAKNALQGWIAKMKTSRNRHRRMKRDFYCFEGHYFLGPAFSSQVNHVKFASWKTTKNWVELTFAKKSGSVTRDREHFWPIADRRVPSNDPRNNCGTQFDSSTFLVSKVANGQRCSSENWNQSF